MAVGPESCCETFEAQVQRHLYNEAGKAKRPWLSTEGGQGTISLQFHTPQGTVDIEVPARAPDEAIPAELAAGGAPRSRPPWPLRRSVGKGSGALHLGPLQAPLDSAGRHLALAAWEFKRGWAELQAVCAELWERAVVLPPPLLPHAVAPPSHRCTAAPPPPPPPRHRPLAPRRTRTAPRSCSSSGGGAPPAAV